jgi:hypothetical protein
MTEEIEKSLAQWRHEIRVVGKKHYLKFYEVKLGQRVSNYARFYKAMSDYGEWAVFDAIVDCADRYITGDPLNYLLSVVRNKWKEQQLEIDQSNQYLSELAKSKEITSVKNAELASKLERAKARTKGEIIADHSI